MAVKDNLRAAAHSALDTEWQKAIEDGVQLGRTFVRLYEAQMDVNKYGMATSLAFQDKPTQAFWLAFQELVGDMQPRQAGDPPPAMQHEDAIVRKSGVVT